MQHNILTSVSFLLSIININLVVVIVISWRDHQVAMSSCAEIIYQLQLKGAIVTQFYIWVNFFMGVKGT